MEKKVTIELEFDVQDGMTPEEEEKAVRQCVYDYLSELIEDDALNYDVE